MRVRLRTGAELATVDVSDSGLLVEGTVRLLPNTHVDVHVVARDGRVLVRSRVVRACVWALEADCVHYRVGLAFDRPVDTSSPGYAIPSATSTTPGDSGSDYPHGAGRHGDRRAEPCVA